MSLAHSTHSIGDSILAVASAAHPLAATSLTFAAGSACDDHPGAHHMLEHLIFHGTNNVSRPALFTIAERHGILFNAYTTRETMSFSALAPAPAGQLGARLLCDLLSNPSVPQSSLDREKAVVLQEAQLSSASPAEAGAEYLQRALLGHRWGNSITGGRENIEKMTREDVLQAAGHLGAFGGAVVGGGVGVGEWGEKMPWPRLGQEGGQAGSSPMIGEHEVIKGLFEHDYICDTPYMGIPDVYHLVVGFRLPGLASPQAAAAAATAETICPLHTPQSPHPMFNHDVLSVQPLPALYSGATIAGALVSARTREAAITAAKTIINNTGAGAEFGARMEGAGIQQVADGLARKYCRGAPADPWSLAGAPPLSLAGRPMVAALLHEVSLGRPLALTDRLDSVSDELAFGRIIKGCKVGEL